nr:MAG TPA: hypothetical protein [Bacteriophage sp.]
MGITTVQVEVVKRMFIILVIGSKFSPIIMMIDNKSITKRKEAV